MPNQTQQQGTDNQAPKVTNVRLNILTTAILALAVLGFAAYLFSVGQGTVGATLAGAVVAHYFTAANGLQTTSNALSTVAAVGGLLSPPAQVQRSVPAQAGTVETLPMSAGGTSTSQSG